ncbi:FMN-dependent NADH-azoreductase [Cohnella luojiensis]|uniref:FMN dependent NADH:quinone oxidoreductase n=1 Tax=Cohnella luojiensis TaxID=652876 RepID=A0A4Y8LP63_9BACL|nr:FMN-dependent NADH-azoreductase [Cohnella luojiensis]
MANVLFVKANDRPSDQAISSRMYNTFLASYKEANPGDVITELDLYNVELPYFGNTALTGLYKLGQGIEPNPEEKRAAEISNQYLDQFLASDKVVIAFPLWNFTVPGPLITYISYLSQAGRTFSYTSEGPIGLAGDKKVALLTARGGDYSLDVMEPMEMALKYVKTIISFWGIHQPESVVIQGHAQYSDRAAQIIESGLNETAAAAAAF